MKKCMQTDNPKVSILMAIYKPNEEWLKEQLHSLNDQTYDNIELIIWDDCPEFPVCDTLLRQCITNFDYRLIRGEKNMGSNGAFEQLTTLATGKYISYCDQDDIWNKEKVEVMVQNLETTGATLVCCDQYIIDENSKKTADSIVEIRKRHVFREGKNLAKYLVCDNFVTGCALMMKTEVAKKAVPFQEYLVHDQWLGIVAALEGEIQVIMTPLIGYRQHSTNQTGILTGVFDKQTYYNMRIEYFLNRVQALKSRLEGVEQVKETLDNYESWLLARQSFFNKPNKKAHTIMKTHKYFGKQTVLLESVLPIIPQFIFKIIIKLAKKGIL